MARVESELPKKEEKSRNWVFTLNNYGDEEIARLAQPYEQYKYIAYGKEIGKNGTPHLQGFLCCWEPQRMASIRKMIPRAHLEVMHGRVQDSERYCSKDGDLVEWGQRPDQGRRTDIIGLKRKICEGHHPMELAINDEGFTPIVAKFTRFATELYQFARFKMIRVDREKPDVYIRIGPPGTGKTRWLDEQFGLDKWIEAPDNTGKWFDGCDLADILVFNDVGYGSIPALDVFKKLTDRYPFRGATKGGFTWLKPKVIVFTSNSTIDEWFPHLSDFDRAAIDRRITEITCVEEYISCPSENHYDAFPQEHESQQDPVSEKENDEEVKAYEEERFSSKYVCESITSRLGIN